MNIRSKLFFPRASIAALTLAASLLSFGATSAKAQFLFNWDRALGPMQIERMIQASGYRLTGPVMRNGAVYLANVLGRENDRERLVIDARDGRLLQRYSAGAARRQFADAEDWRAPPRQDIYDGWFDREEDSPAPRPPVDVYGGAGPGLLHGPLVRPAPQGGQVARAEAPNGAAGASSPYIIMAPSDAAHAPATEKAKPKPQVKHRKPEPTPVAQPATPPGDSKPAPVAVQPTTDPSAPSNPQPATNSQAAISPNIATTPNVATPARPSGAGEAPPPAPRVADTKPVATPPAPESAPAAPQPKASRPKPALNDVPAAPLE
jgi:hypothetical protein